MSSDALLSVYIVSKNLWDLLSTFDYVRIIKGNCLDLWYGNYLKDDVHWTKILNDKLVFFIYIGWALFYKRFSNIKHLMGQIKTGKKKLHSNFITFVSCLI